MAKEPFRLSLLKAITANLSEISADDDYANTLAGKVFRGRDSFDPDADPLPLVAILEDGKAEILNQETRGGRTITRLGLIIQGFAMDDPENPTDPAHILLGDLQRKLAREKKRAGSAEMPGLPAANDYFGFQGKVTGIKIGAGVVAPPDGLISTSAICLLPLELSIVEDFDA